MKLWLKNSKRPQRLLSMEGPVLRPTIALWHYAHHPSTSSRETTYTFARYTYSLFLFLHVRMASDDTSNHGFEIHIIRGNGTNSAAAQQSKVHFSMAVSLYFAGMQAESVEDNIDGELVHLQPVRSAVADLQFIPTSSTGETIFETYQVQMRSMGIPSFDQLVPPRVLRAYVFVTDDGPDQRGAQKLISAALKDFPSVLYVRFKCLLHQLHLIVGKQLKRLDGLYSQIAKVVNVWRATGNAWKIYNTYCDMFGEKRARQVAKRLPPRALKGRWGSISSVESFLLNCGATELPAVFKAAVGGTDFQTDGEDSALVQIHADQVFDMDTETYRNLLGRWRREAIKCLHSNTFWLTVAIGSGTRGPLDHLMNWIMKTDAAPGTGKLPMLSFHKLESIMSEFSNVLDADSPRWSLFQTLVAKEANQSQWVAMLVAAALEQASEMNRRVVQYLTNFPAKLAWMVFEEPEVECSVRKALANEIIVCSDDDLDETFTRKFKAFYLQDLKLCSVTGMIGLDMHRFLSAPWCHFQFIVSFFRVGIWELCEV